jgi:hypothetical protein
MRALEMALAALALRASPTQPATRERRLVPAVDDADAAWLARTALPQQRAALIASLWPPPARQCVAAPHYVALPAPAAFGLAYRVSWSAAPVAEPSAAVAGRIAA